MKPKSLIALTLSFLAFAFPAIAQESKDEKPQAKAPVVQSMYKLDLAVYELQDGKRSNVRKYLMFVRGGGPSSEIKVGNRVPVNIGNSSNTAQMQYMDVGLRMSCRDANEKDGMFTIATDFELGSLVLPDHPEPGSLGAPVVRQLRENGYAQIPMGKPSVILSIEDTNSPRTVQVEVTATKL